MKGWIFDLDGTLVDSLPGIAQSLNHALGRHGFPQHSEAQVRHFIGDGAVTLVRRALGTEHADHAGKVLESFRDFYAEGWKNGTIPYPGILDLLKKLRLLGHKTAILSNKPHRFTAEIAETLFPNLFDIALGEGGDVLHKPDPAGVHIILKEWQLPNEYVALVGDSVMDLQAARAAGIHAIAVTWGYHDRTRLIAEAPDRICDEVAELSKLLDSP